MTVRREPRGPVRPEATLPPACVPAPGGGCSICGDEGLEGEVLAIDGWEARVQLPGGVAEIALDLLDDVRPGDRVIVHQGFAIARVDPAAGRSERFGGGGGD